MSSKRCFNSNLSTSTIAHNCVGNPDAFCYICGKFEVLENRRVISDDIKTIYKSYFGMEVQNQSENWVPHKICCACYKAFNRLKGRKGNKKTLKIQEPTIWRKPLRKEECYFCMTNLTGINRKKKSAIEYPDVPSVTKSVENNDVTKNSKNLSLDRQTTEAEENKSTDEDFDVDRDESDISDYGNDEDDDESSDVNTEVYIPDNEKNKVPKLFTSEELNDLSRDLGLPKDASEYLASVLKKKNLLAKGVKSSFYRNREKEFRQFFTSEENDHGKLVYCKNIDGLMEKMKPGLYRPENWRLFIDSSKRSLKAVLLHNTNVYAPIPIAHSTELKEHYSNLKFVLEKINYSTYKWKICGDLKILGIVLGQQSGYTKTPCYLCLWDSRDRVRHYKKKDGQKEHRLSKDKKI